MCEYYKKEASIFDRLCLSINQLIFLSLLDAGLPFHPDLVTTLTRYWIIKEGQQSKSVLRHLLETLTGKNILEKLIDWDKEDCKLCHQLMFSSDQQQGFIFRQRKDGDSSEKTEHIRKIIFSSAMRVAQKNLDNNIGRTIFYMTAMNIFRNTSIDTEEDLQQAFILFESVHRQHLMEKVPTGNNITDMMYDAERNQRKAIYEKFIHACYEAKNLLGVAEYAIRCHAFLQEYISRGRFSLGDTDDYCASVYRDIWAVFTNEAVCQKASKSFGLTAFESIFAFFEKNPMRTTWSLEWQQRIMYNYIHFFIHCVINVANTYGKFDLTFPWGKLIGLLESASWNAAAETTKHIPELLIKCNAVLNNLLATEYKAPTPGFAWIVPFCDIIQRTLKVIIDNGVGAEFDRIYKRESGWLTPSIPKRLVELIQRHYPIECLFPSEISIRYKRICELSEILPFSFSDVYLNNNPHTAFSAAANAEAPNDSVGCVLM